MSSSRKSRAQPVREGDDGPDREAEDQHLLTSHTVRQIAAERAGRTVNPEEDGAEQPQVKVIQPHLRTDQREDGKHHLAVQVVQTCHHPEQRDYQPGIALFLHESAGQVGQRGSTQCIPQTGLFFRG